MARSRSDKDAYDVVRGRIMSGHYPPGAHLTESALSDELNVSRTPVRAALRRLSADGFVTVVPHRGAFVAEWTRSDIDEVYELRAVLESRAAGLAAQRRTDADVAALERSTADMARIVAERGAGFRDELLHNNREFHLLVLETARAPRLFAITRTLADTSVTLGAWYRYADDDIHRSLGHHQEITRAIAAGNAAVAAALMLAHLETAHAAFVRDLP